MSFNFAPLINCYLITTLLLSLLNLGINFERECTLFSSNNRCQPIKICLKLEENAF